VKGYVKFELNPSGISYLARSGKRATKIFGSEPEGRSVKLAELGGKPKRK